MNFTGTFLRNTLCCSQAPACDSEKKTLKAVRRKHYHRFRHTSAGGAVGGVPPIVARGPWQEARCERLREIVERPGHDNVVVNADDSRYNAHADTQS